MKDQQIVNLNINELQTNPLQPRRAITPESLVDLADSIREHGVLEPLVVAKTPAGFQIIAGERRWRASKLVGMKTVPVIIKETTPRGMLEMALVENVQREDLNPLERAQAFFRLMEEFNLTNKEIAKRIGKSPSYVSNSLRLLSLPDALKDGLLSGLITEGHARALASIEDSKLMVEAYKIILRESGSVRRAEEIARRMRKKEGRPAQAAAHIVVSEEIDKIQDDIYKTLGGNEKVRIKLLRSRVETKLLIVLKGNLEVTEKKLQRVYQSICKT
ncbi:ParB/RepB/Spo0J family partition protein [Patescibacteria group bacterium]